MPLNQELTNEIRELKEQFALARQEAADDRELLRQVIDELRRQTQASLDRVAPARQLGLLPLSAAWKQTSAVSEQAARRRCLSGHWRQGHEWFDNRTPGAANARIYLDVTACDERDRTRPSQRRPLRSVG